MKLINLTKISNKTIKTILKDLGISKANVKLAILVNPDLGAQGKCNLLEDGMIVVSLLNDRDIPTLAHELKHAEQYVSGLYEFVVAEMELTEYDKQWHEVEAVEYESKYKVA